MPRSGGGCSNMPTSSRRPGVPAASARWPTTNRRSGIGSANGTKRCRRSAGGIPPGSTGKTAAELAAKLRKLLDERPGHPDAEAFRQRLPYLEAIVHRIDGEGNPIESGAQARFHRSPRGRRMDADGFDRAEVLLAGRPGGKVRTAGRLAAGAARTASNMLSVSIFPRSEKIAPRRRDQRQPGRCPAARDRTGLGRDP